jgi:hypothetical protein
VPYKRLPGRELPENHSGTMPCSPVYARPWSEPWPTSSPGGS